MSGDGCRVAPLRQGRGRETGRQRSQQRDPVEEGAAADPLLVLMHG
jgi:hypothetical protein